MHCGMSHRHVYIDDIPINSLLNIMLIGFPAILDRLNSDNEIFVKFSRKQ